MKKTLILMLIIVSSYSFSTKKDKQELKLPDIEAQMEKADKIESYKSKKNLAWHKTEYNKVLKHLNKTRK